MLYFQSARHESAGFSRVVGSAMRSVEQYLARAAEFDDMANATSVPVLKNRYSDNAECYRLLAYERQRLIDEGVIESEMRLNRCWTFHPFGNGKLVQRVARNQTTRNSTRRPAKR
jgi:hypothetical protein